MAFAFGQLAATTSKKHANLELRENPVLVDSRESSNKYVLILTDEYLVGKNLKNLQVLLKQNSITDYIMVCALNVDVMKSDIKGNLSDFYANNQSSWHQYSQDARAIVSVGDALYSINKSTILLVDHFRDVIFNKTHYWAPKAHNWVFPIDTMSELFPPTGNPTPAITWKLRFAEHQLQQLNILKLNKPRLVKPKLIEITSREQLLEVFAEYKDKKHIALDIETSGFNFMTDRLGCFSFAFNSHTAYFSEWDPKIVDPHELNQLLDGKIIIGANFKFDTKFFWKNGVFEKAEGVDEENIWKYPEKTNLHVHEDIVQLGHVLNELRSNGLKSLAYMYTTHGGYDDALETYKKTKRIDNYLDIDKDVLKEYATMDALVTYAVWEAEQRHLDWIDENFPNEKLPNKTMRMYYEDVMMPAVRAFTRIEYQGVYVDRDLLNLSRQELLDMIDDLEGQLRKAWKLDASFDISSPTQLGKLFEKMGWEDLGRNKRGIYSTSDDLLERWKQLGHEEIALMQKLRSVKTVLRAFISESATSSTEAMIGTIDINANKGWEQYIVEHPDHSNKMHPVFNVMRTDTGRCKSNSPNMQNIPAHGPLAKKVKRCLAAPDPKEYYLSTIDYGSLQIRLAAIDTVLNDMGKDVALYEVYTNPELGGDMHSNTGWAVFAKGREFELDIVEVFDDKTNKTYKFFADEFIKTKRGKIPAKELQETDELLM
jgi:DNA polymerase I-like protein with 3'-5' exonuclease and polymerase domains